MGVSGPEKGQERDRSAGGGTGERARIAAGAVAAAAAQVELPGAIDGLVQGQPLEPPRDGRLAGRIAAATADRGGAAGTGSRCEGFAIRRPSADGGTGRGSAGRRGAGRAAGAGGDRLRDRTSCQKLGERLIGWGPFRRRPFGQRVNGRQRVDRSHCHEGWFVHQRRLTSGG